MFRPALAIVALSVSVAVPGPAAPDPAGQARQGRTLDVKAKKGSEPATTHKVKRGETLWAIARLHGVSVGDLMDLNGLKDEVLRESQTLRIPRATPDADPAAPAPNTHVIARGETVRGIARRYGVTVEALTRANPRMDPQDPKAGVRLQIPVLSGAPVASGSTPQAPAAPAKNIHLVADNDTFYSIARKYGVTIEAVTAANPGIRPERLRPGSNLVVPSPEAASERQREIPAASAPEAPVDPETKSGDESKGPKTRRYIVSADETPQTISDAFNIPLQKLYEMNGLTPGTPMKTGMEIQVPILPFPQPPE